MKRCRLRGPAKSVVKATTGAPAGEEGRWAPSHVDGPSRLQLRTQGGGVSRRGLGLGVRAPPPPRAAAQLPVLQHVLNLMNTRSFSEYTGDNHFPSHHRHGQFDELIPRGSASVQLRVCRR